jgi:hypothetical protein
MIGMRMGYEYRIDFRKLVKRNSWRTDTRQELAKRRIEVRICEKPFSGKLN